MSRRRTLHLMCALSENYFFLDQVVNRCMKTKCITKLKKSWLLCILYNKWYANSYIQGVHWIFWIVLIVILNPFNYFIGCLRVNDDSVSFFGRNNVCWNSLRHDEIKLHLDIKALRMYYWQLSNLRNLFLNYEEKVSSSRRWRLQKYICDHWTSESEFVSI
jgi:hypothetical protein